MLLNVIQPRVLQGKSPRSHTLFATKTTLSVNKDPSSSETRSGSIDETPGRSLLRPQSKNKHPVLTRVQAAANQGPAAVFFPDAKTLLRGQTIYTSIIDRDSCSGGTSSSQTITI